MDIFLPVFLVLLTCVTEAQRTYQRACDCEYKVNGKCAYTLLLPVGGQDSSGGPTCPTSVPNEDQISGIQTDISKVKTEMADQSRMLNQLQNSVLYQQETVRNFTNKFTGQVSCSGCDEAKIKTDEQAVQIKALNTTLSRQTNTINSLQTQVEKYQEDIDALMKVSSTEKLLNESKALQNYVKQLQETVSNLTKTNKLCQKKGLLVSGPDHRIPDSSITVSSQYDPSHAVNTSRIWYKPEPGSKMSGAWCPDEPNLKEEWIQYDFGKPVSVQGSVTQGRHDYPQWVSWYLVKYTNETPTNTTQWEVYSDVTDVWMYLAANVDQKSTRVNWFWQPFTARYVRIIPTWGGYHEGTTTNMCMRADVIGCLD